MAPVHVSKWHLFPCQNGTIPMAKQRMSQNNSNPNLSGACLPVKMAAVHVPKMARKMAAVSVPGVGSRCEVVGPICQVRPFNGEHVVIAS